MGRIAIEWGGESGRHSVGIDLVVVAQNNDTVTLRIDRYVRTSFNSINDDQTLHFSGSGGSGAVGFHMGTPNNNPVLVHQMTLVGGKSYGGGPTWTFHVSLSGVFNGGTPSFSRSYTIPAKSPSAPAAPGLNTPSSIQSDRASFSWSTPANNGSSLNRYQLQVDNNSNFSSPVFNGDYAWGTSRTVTGLTRATQYHSRVRARNGVNWGPWSNTRTFTTKATVPDTPATPTVDQITSSSARINMSLPNNGGAAITNTVLGYYTTATGGTAVTDGVGDTRTSHTFTGLTRARNYWAEVWASNSVGSGGHSARRQFTTLATAPDAPGTPSLSGATSTTVNVAWAAPNNGGSGITGYDIQWSLASNFSGATTIARPTSPLSYQIGGLTPGTDPYVRVRAKNAIGAGAWSPSVRGSLLTGGRYWTGTAFGDGVPYWWDGDSWVLADEIRWFNGSAFVVAT